MKTSNNWFFLSDAEQRQLAYDMSANSLANSALLTSDTMATPLGYVFDFWSNDDEARAQALLVALLTKRPVGGFNEAFTRLEAALFAVHNVDGGVIASFGYWLNQNGLNVQTLLAGHH